MIKNVLITGADGFLGKNLRIKLKEKKIYNIFSFTKENSLDELYKFIQSSDIVFHLAGENRPHEESLFEENNYKLTKKLCEYLQELKKEIPVIFSSSTQAINKSLYGLSKLNAEKELINLSKISRNKISIYRFPGIFGKWSKPNYNSVVATFANNIANDIPIKITDEKNLIELVYVDDVIEDLIKNIDNHKEPVLYADVSPKYKITLGELRDMFFSFKESRSSLLIGDVGEGLERALYSTYLSFIDKNNFSYKLTKNIDNRGEFVEVLKTKKNGQFSFFTAKPGVTRGGHYHHTKNEKFVVLSGHAKFKFENLITREIFSITTSSDDAMVIETIPGWLHDITNIGNDELKVMLWANELFDSNKPDTFAMEFSNEKT